MTEGKSAPRFFSMTDWRLYASLALLVMLGLMAWDRLNSTLNAWLAPKAAPAPNPATWTEGSEHHVGITLITADRDKLACGDSRRFGDAHCEFDSSKNRVTPATAPAAGEHPAERIQPYRTALGNHLVFIAGVWNTPEVALRYTQEPPQGKADKQLRRFAATCKLRFVGSVEKPWVRWQPTANWYTEKSAPVAIAESCKIQKSSFWP